jgi:hypothetical protein
MAVLYSELVIDGVLGDIYDKAAIHSDQLQEALTSQLVNANIKNVLLDVLFPVGSVKIGGPNPGTYLGGRWVLRSDRMIVGAGNLYSVGATGGSADSVVVEHSHTGTGFAESSGEHIHTFKGSTANAGNHTHTWTGGWNFSLYKGAQENEDVGEISGSKWRMTQVSISSGGSWTGNNHVPEGGTHSHSFSGSADKAGAHTHNVTVTVDQNGASGKNMNMPPYLAYNIWERIA